MWQVCSYDWHFMGVLFPVIHILTAYLPSMYFSSELFEVNRTCHHHHKLITPKQRSNNIDHLLSTVHLCSLYLPTRYSSLSLPIEFLPQRAHRLLILQQRGDLLPLALPHCFPRASYPRSGGEVRVIPTAWWNRFRV